MLNAHNYSNRSPRLRPIGFRQKLDSLYGAFWLFTRSTITPPKVNRFGWNLEHSEYIVGGWPLQILGEIRAVATAGKPGEILFFWFHRFFVSQISRNLNITRRSVSRWKLSEQNLEILRRGVFSKNAKIFNVLRLQAAVTPQWLQIAGNSLPK